MPHAKHVKMLEVRKYFCQYNKRADGLSFRRLIFKVIYTWAQVTGVELSTQDSGFFGTNSEGIRLSFENGKRLMIRGDNYRNVPVMRAYMQE